jgi:hypothetical protein
VASNDYAFVTYWRMKSTPEEIFEILGDAADLTRWWPSVYLDAKVIQTGNEYGVGGVTDLYTKGWLPYTLRWRFTVTEANYPNRIALDAVGDFVGKGVWTFKPDGEYVGIIYDWRISAEKPLLRNLSFLFKPIFEANHRWAMRQGERSLNLELARRHATSPETRARIPAPPGPTFARKS